MSAEEQLERGDYSFFDNIGFEAQILYKTKDGFGSMFQCEMELKQITGLIESYERYYTRNDQSDDVKNIYSLQREITNAVNAGCFKCHYQHNNRPVYKVQDRKLICKDCLNKQ
jgi:hypothetical protein